MTQAQKDVDDIIEAASQAQQYPTPYTHRQMRMASQMASQVQGMCHNATHHRCCDCHLRSTWPSSRGKIGSEY